MLKQPIYLLGISEMFSRKIYELLQPVRNNFTDKENESLNDLFRLVLSNLFPTEKTEEAKTPFPRTQSLTAQGL